MDKDFPYKAHVNKKGRSQMERPAPNRTPNRTTKMLFRSTAPKKTFACVPVRDPTQPSKSHTTREYVRPSRSLRPEPSPHELRATAAPPRRKRTSSRLAPETPKYSGKRRTRPPAACTVRPGWSAGRSLHDRAAECI